MSQHDRKRLLSRPPSIADKVSFEENGSATAGCDSRNIRSELRRRLATSCNDDHLVVAALGGAELVSYGTLYYCVAVVANEVARDFAVTDEWIFACLSLALFASAMMSSIAGRLMDRYGAGRTMIVASVVGATCLGIAAISWSAAVFAIALFGTQIASAFLFYEAGVVFLIQRDAIHAKRQLAMLTLIVGLSSTLFWPLTSFLLTLISWRAVFGIYAGCNILVALPLVVWALRRRSVRCDNQSDIQVTHDHSRAYSKAIEFVLMTIGFSLAAFIISAFLGQMIQIFSSIDLGPNSALIAALFGPSQALIGLFAGSLAERIAATHLALVSCFLLSAATVIILLASHSLAGITAFVVLLGFSAALNSICRGTLPLAMFGQDGYGSRLGWISLFRLSAASFAPFCFSFVHNQYGIMVALGFLAACGVGCMIAFVGVSMRLRPVEGERV
ncbi:MFS transporter [Bradyrhizobium sp. BR 1432]|uniref:MFS transporter n=1 Tax=Bradyrhizobium sp. BR 1432 TaxID=3447966 RepID=UPI003EE673B9